MFCVAVGNHKAKPYTRCTKDKEKGYLNISLQGYITLQRKRAREDRVTKEFKNSQKTINKIVCTYQ